MDLPDELRSSILASQGKDPILHHLNADSSWLFQVPNSTFQPGRKFFNILIDPWLSGPQSDVASWFSKQWHAIAPHYSSIAAVEALCWHVERLLDAASVEEKPGKIDAVVISHEFTDHCHEGTMRQLDPKTALFANDKAIQLIKSWKHFDQASIHEIPGFSPDWLALSRPPLPKSLSISRLQNGGDFLYYHSAVVISFLDPDLNAGKCLIYTPHGLPCTNENPLLSCTPPLQTLALLHGLHDVSIPWGGPFKSGTQQLNLGAHNALKLQRQIKAKYWLSTHDEVKKGGGLVGLLLKRKVIPLDDALKMEKRGEQDAESAEDAKVIDMENGKGMVLL
ncbi:uncharacterized protein PV09_06401 [Verruconis gallopava]|uniref:Metallo-beta-lactamase domain-containing protein n=1 Tax=Verruconis gallopava TaxID=253628 RepID=A0A0D2ASW4_9PEZI|nr:uncharacterized protein PV09_06401 [Verruconis gallopava]KIW02249.1 hypothetical protein PV09_06401 [Verruconis gallopava]